MNTTLNERTNGLGFDSHCQSYADILGELIIVCCLPMFTQLYQVPGGMKYAQL